MQAQQFLDGSQFIGMSEEEIARSIKSTVRRKKTFLYCSNRGQADRIAELLGIRACACHSGNTKDLNRTMLTVFRAGGVQYVAVVNRLKEYFFDPSDAQILVYLPDNEQDAAALPRKVRSRKQRYPTWQEAAQAAMRLGCKKQADYIRLYKQDPLLLARPSDAYKDFPGWPAFFDRYYRTLGEAMEAVHRLSIPDLPSYELRHKEDPKLPSKPDEFYPDFIGYIEFFGRERKKPYPTWQEAGAAAQQLGLGSQRDYKRRYKKDPRLPGNPSEFYKDFSSWLAFLGKEEPTWAKRGRMT